MCLLWRGPKRVRDIGLGIAVCAGCFKVFNASMGNVRHCPRCAPARRSRAKPHQAKRCEHCGTNFTPARSDAITCSGRCRVALHRGQQRKLNGSPDGQDG
jgi:predicted nucleic acid-binding Zn ribbon protein